MHTAINKPRPSANLVNLRTLKQVFILLEMGEKLMPEVVGFIVLLPPPPISKSNYAYPRNFFDGLPWYKNSTCEACAKSVKCVPKKSRSHLFNYNCMRNGTGSRCALAKICRKICEKLAIRDIAWLSNGKGRGFQAIWKPLAYAPVSILYSMQSDLYMH